MLEHFVHELPDFDTPQELETVLNDISQEGWELCGVTINNCAVFKRPLRIASDQLEKVRERQRLTKTLSKRKVVKQPAE